MPVMLEQRDKQDQKAIRGKQDQQDQQDQKVIPALRLPTLQVTMVFMRVRMVPG
jgi:hypothetical protein